VRIFRGVATVVSLGTGSISKKETGTHRSNIAWLSTAVELASDSDRAAERARAYFEIVALRVGLKHNLVRFCSLGFPHLTATVTATRRHVTAHITITSGPRSVGQGPSATFVACA
jgi:hypothetical protein